jgi:predicted dehydrogenase
VSRATQTTRRTAVKATAAAAIAAPFIQKAKAANETVQYGFIGSGSRGQYLLGHMKSLDNGRCVAIADIVEDNAKKGAEKIGSNPKLYKDYRELLADKNVDAVCIATPLFTHFPITKDALLAGKNVFCEKSLVFRPEEVHELRALANDRPKQVLQVGLQRRYSTFYDAAHQMIQKGLIGDVMHIYAQWHRGPLSAWRMRGTAKEMGQERWELSNWRLFRKFSGGLTAELASHQIDVADRMFDATPEFVTGVGGLDYMKDGRDVYDNIELIFKYPKGQKLVYTSISTSNHLALFGSERTQFGEMICGTAGTIHITVGTDNEPAMAVWYPEAQPYRRGEAQKEAAKATASLASTGKGQRALPILLDRDTLTEKDSFLEKELKYARRWLYAKGVMLPEEDRNPVDVAMESFLNDCKRGARPKADLEIGLADSTAVILANLAMDEGRRVYFNEIEKMGKPGMAPGKRS